MSGIYIHIPFCHSKCYYCDFFSTPNASYLAQYVDALHREYEVRKSEIQLPPNTIYIGGGTPSILPIEHLQRIIDFLPLEAVEEFTIEVNPEDITEELAKYIVESPINRVSMGIQTFNDSVLKAIGRRHSESDVFVAVERLRDAGVSNLSLDLIFGLPDQTLSEWESNLDKVLSLNPEHLSTYSLMYEPGTKLWAMRESGKIKEVTDDLAEQMYLLLCEKLGQSGYEHYEISNFGKSGYYSRHNSAYWNLTPYLGLGVSAHSFDGSVRRFNPSNIKKYIDSSLPIYIAEDATLSERINEYLLIRLRTAEGVNLNQYKQLFGLKEFDRLLSRAKYHINLGNLKYSPDYLSIPYQHWLISDSILVDLFVDSN